MRALNSIEKILLSAGLLLLLFYAGARLSAALLSRIAVDRFSSVQAHPGDSSRAIADSPQTPDFRLWSEKRIAAYQATLESKFPLPLAVLKIPAIHLEVAVLPDTDDLTLDRGVGHIDNTAAPGEMGNIGIAGHRDGFFRGLKNLQLRDELELDSQTGAARYEVEWFSGMQAKIEDILKAEIRTKPHSAI